MRSDNAGVVKPLRNRKWITKYGLYDVIFALCDEGKLCLQMKRVSTKANPANRPSRGVYPSKILLFQHRPELPMEFAEIIHCYDKIRLRSNPEKNSHDFLQVKLNIPCRHCQRFLVQNAFRTAVVFA